jgi:glycosyltransferase involved in cell wall biosynthesis
MKKLLITLPCYNEEEILDKNARVILSFIEDNLQEYDWKLLIVDNASTDRTYQIATNLARENPRVITYQCFEKGRGVALTRAWSKFVGYDTYSYMDIDLATDLRDFKNLLSHVENGHPVVVGSRYTNGADIQRLPKREFLSRIYNGMLRLFFGVKFKDAQCGFKAFNGSTLSALLPHTSDAGWFWDTELLILAERAGHEVKEIPVVWREIRDEIRKSKVSPFVEVARQLKNIYKLRRDLGRKEALTREA